MAESACAATGRRCLLAIRTWAAKARRQGGSQVGSGTDLERVVKRPDLVIVDGVRVEGALIGLWGEELPIKRSRAEAFRTLLGQPRSSMHDELTRTTRHDLRRHRCRNEIRRKAFLAQMPLNAVRCRSWRRRG